MSKHAYIGCPRCLVKENGVHKAWSILNPESSSYSNLPGDGEGLYSQDTYLPIYSIQIYVEIYAAVAFVNIKSIFINKCHNTVDGIFVFPTNDSKSIISSCEISYGDTTFNTTIIDSENAKYLSDSLLTDILEDYSTNNSITSLLNTKAFKMPFHSCPSNSEIHIDLKYTQDLFFNPNSSEYEFIAPSFIPPSQPIHMNLQHNDIVSVICKLLPGNLSTSTFEYKSS